MMQKKCSFGYHLLLAVGSWMLIAVLSMPTIVYADDPDPTPNQGKCITCHEDLYFLHDTGNWFCLREAPMSCADCHGGNPLATTQELAHLGRAAHPVINEDISKCQECHPEECTERMQIFDQTAGISQVMVAMPYTPKAIAEISSEIPVESREDHNAWETLPILLLVGAALGAYFLHKQRAVPRK